MPILLNCISNFALGASLAWVLRHNRAIANGREWPLYFLATFEAFIVTPVTTYLVRFYPQWSTSYIFDPQIFPRWERWVSLLALATVALNFVAAIGGYRLCRSALLRHGGRPWPYPLGLVATAWWVVALVLMGREIVALGDYDSHWLEQNPLWVKAPAAVVTLATYVGGMVFVWWVKRQYRERQFDFMRWLP